MHDLRRQQQHQTQHHPQLRLRQRDLRGQHSRVPLMLPGVPDLLSFSHQLHQLQRHCQLQTHRHHLPVCQRLLSGLGRLNPPVPQVPLQLRQLHRRCFQLPRLQVRRMDQIRLGMRVQQSHPICLLRQPNHRGILRRPEVL